MDPMGFSTSVSKRSVFCVFFFGKRFLYPFDLANDEAVFVGGFRILEKMSKSPKES